MQYRYPLKQLEYPIVKHCNLKCVNCDHLSPLYSAEYAALDTVIADIRRAAALFSPERFYLLGGEPTLHPNINDIIAEASKYFKVAIVSNGLRIFDIPGEILGLLTSIDISMYPELQVNYNKIYYGLVSILVGKECKLRMRHQDDFYNGWADSPLSDAEMMKSYQTCLIAHEWKCYSIYDGVFYKCSRIHVADKHARRIGYNIIDFRDNGLNLHDTDFLSRLPRYLDPENIPGACRICLGTSTPWVPHSQHERPGIVKS